MSRLALIDADSLVYRIGFKCQRSKTLDNGEEILILEEEQDVRDSLEQTLATILHDTGARERRIFIGGSGNYRQDIATLQVYKGNRDPNYKPAYYDFIRDYIQREWNGVLSEGEEADDLAGIAQYKRYWEYVTGEIDQESVLVTYDKDLDMIPGLHYNWVKKELYNVTSIEAERNFYRQMLTGDTSDNIPGLYRITGSKATKGMKQEIDKLDNSREMYEYVRSVYKSRTDKDVDVILLEIGRLLWIRREEGELWEPPSA